MARIGKVIRIGKLGVFGSRLRKSSTFKKSLEFWLSGAVIFGFFMAIGIQGCKPAQKIIQKEQIIWTYKDSIVERDSICYIPIERYVDIVPIYDTLILESSVATSRSWVDTANHLLGGELRSKDAITYQVKYVERLITNDSIVEREVPVPYEVEVIKRHIPIWAWITLVWTILTVASIVWTVYRKLRS